MSNRVCLLLVCIASSAGAQDWEAVAGAGAVFGLDRPGVLVEHSATLHLVDARVSLALRLHGGLLLSQLALLPRPSTQSRWFPTAFPYGAAIGVRVKLVAGVFARALVGGAFVNGCVNGDYCGGGGPTGSVELGVRLGPGQLGFVALARVTVLMHMGRFPLAIPGAALGLAW